MPPQYAPEKCLGYAIPAQNLIVSAARAARGEPGEMFVLLSALM
jgi:hypothetical protein